MLVIVDVTYVGVEDKSDDVGSADVDGTAEEAIADEMDTQSSS